MSSFVELIIGAACFIIPLMMGWMIGGSVERRHFADLDEREDRMRLSMIVTQMKRPLYPLASKLPPRILTTEVVIASDYLKTYLAGWRGLFGGEIRSYRTLLERARREAVLRMLEEAQTLGFNAIANVRLSPCEIGGKAAMAVIIATGTAYHSSIHVRDESPREEPPHPLRPLKETGNPYQADGQIE